MNAAIKPLLAKLNDQPFQKLEGSRNSWFETLEKGQLLPLPATAFELANWSKAKVNIDYHVAVEKHFYSAPYQLIHQQLDVRLTDKTVELFQHGKRVAAHLRSYRAGRSTTLEEHRPKSHQRYLEWTPSRILEWVKTIGPDCAKVVEKIMADRPHPEQGFRSALGIIRLGKAVGNDRAGSRLPARLALWHLFLSQPQVHSPKQPGSPTPGAGIALAQPGPRKSPGRSLLPLNPKTNFMLFTQTLEKLHALRLEGMAQALEEQRRQTDIVQLDFEERLALLVERQWLWKENRGVGRPAEERAVQNQRQPGGPGLPQLAGLKAGADRATARLPVGQGAPQLPHHRADRLGQNLPGLRCGRPGLPRRLPDALLLRAQVLPGAGERPGRRKSVASCSRSWPEPRC